MGLKSKWMKICTRIIWTEISVPMIWLKFWSKSVVVGSRLNWNKMSRKTGRLGTSNKNELNHMKITYLDKYYRQIRIPFACILMCIPIHSDVVYKFLRISMDFPNLRCIIYGSVDSRVVAPMFLPCLALPILKLARQAVPVKSVNQIHRIGIRNKATMMTI